MKRVKKKRNGHSITEQRKNKNASYILCMLVLTIWDGSCVLCMFVYIAVDDSKPHKTIFGNRYIHKTKIAFK